MENPAVVIDNGTGYTKMGFSSNLLPSYDFPTSIASKSTLGVPVSRLQCDDLDFYIGEEAFFHQKTHQLVHPIKEGQINDWDEMEKFWQRSIFEKLHVEPQAHNFLLTEPPMNTPENREQIAEIFFETFDVKGLYLGVQAVFALQGYNFLTDRSGQSGVVVDAGDGVTHIIPIAHGYVINSCVKQIPLAGRDITKYIMKVLKDRGERIPAEDLLDTAKTIKEKFCYVCKNPDSEEKQYRDESSDKYKIYEGVGKYTGTPLRVKVGNERFRGPEVFFSPARMTNVWDKPLGLMVDLTIQSCPIDIRRELYGSIVLSGGTTSFKHFNSRLQKDLQKLIDARLQTYSQLGGGTARSITAKIEMPEHQRHLVWIGAAQFASHPQFKTMVNTREDYMEKGPSIARSNIIFGEGM